ncbi:MAG: prolyl oligopeptidase family serine peptidase [Alistipes sp.]|jgi:prolyl oligopeptidase|nr:prolyl oligopeptidase family serine peptidase [Alistipes sp.]
MKKLLTVALAGALAAGCADNAKNRITMKPYPDTRRSEVVENYHGTQVADPYRWLEDADSAETAAWVAAENEVTFDYLSQIPYRDAVRARLTELWDYPKTGVPTRVGEWYFVFRNDGLQNQSVLYRQKGLDGAPEVFLDPNTLSDDGTVALADVSFSRDHRWCAYAVAAAGSDWVKIHVRDVATGTDTGEVIEWVKFSGAVWAPDSRGFYYSCYEAPSDGNIYSAQNQFQMVYYHALGTPQSADVRVYRDPSHPLRYFHGEASDDGRWLFVSGSEGTSGTELLYRAAGESRFRVLFPGFRYDYAVVHAEGDTAWIYTNDGAPNFRLASIDLANPSQGLRDVIAENPESKLEWVSTVGGYFVAQWLVDASSRVSQHRMDGTPVRDIELATLGTAAGFAGEKEDTSTFYSLSTYTAPPTIYSLDLETGASKVFDRPEVAFNPDDFTTEQIFFESADGTRVPMFVMHKKGLLLDGSNPTYLYGYGGFNISLTPAFSPARVMFMEQGGVYVEVNLRGGGEYGERWHEAGMLDRKQNVFDDFIAAAGHLIANRYTSPAKLAIAGGSNGGLLVGAAMTQRPDLFAVALPAVGVMDMLRYHKFTVGWGWSVEYGNSDDPAQFEYIYKYSPLHNLRAGTCYPATLITTADHDDRVVPAHSFKFAAELQHSQSCDAPVLIRIETNAGHGAGKPTSKRIDEAADIWSFVLQNTNTKFVR